MLKKTPILILFLLSICYLYPQEFNDITTQVKLNNIAKSNAISVADYNQDGLLDLFIVARLETCSRDASTKIAKTGVNVTSLCSRFG